MPHEPGDLLAGRYRLDDRIASGGMGEVWHATDTVLSRPVAVKTLRTDRALDSQFQRRFRNEARAMAALHHPGIVDVYDYGQEPDGDAYLVMAHVHGQPLDQRIAERGRLTTAETMSVVAQTARALQAAHDTGIVHRDVKPANLIVRPDGAVVLVDFGIARSPDSTALTGAGQVLGTVAYIAPEQITKQNAGPPADIYALGAVAYHCLAGHPPFPGDNPIAIALQHVNDPPPPLPDDVPPAARTLVTTALAKNPTARHPSAAAMAAAAEAAGDDAETTIPLRTGYAAPPPAEPAGRTGRRALLAVLAGLVVLLGTGAAFAVADPFGWFTGTPEPSPSASAPPAPASEPATTERTAPAEDGTGATDEETTQKPKRTPSSSRAPTSPDSPSPAESPGPTETSRTPPSPARSENP